jgi:hypothetical protein
MLKWNRKDEGIRLVERMQQTRIIKKTQKLLILILVNGKGCTGVDEKIN